MKNPVSLRNYSDFKNVYEKGKSLANKKLVMYVLENGLDFNRLGISASKKMGNSIVRHRFARLIREGYRLNEDFYKKGFDMVFIMRAGSKDAKMQDVQEAMMNLAGRHHIIKEK